MNPPPPPQSDTAPAEHSRRDERPGTAPFNIVYSLSPLSGEEVSEQTLHAIRAERSTREKKTEGQRERASRFIRERNNDTADFILGVMIGIGIWISAGLAYMGYALGDASSEFLTPLGAAVSGVLLVLGLYLYKSRGHYMLMHGMVVSLICGIFFLSLVIKA